MIFINNIDQKSNLIVRERKREEFNNMYDLNVAIHDFYLTLHVVFVYIYMIDYHL